MLAPPGDNRLLGLTSKSTANVGLRLSAVVWPPRSTDRCWPSNSHPGAGL